jgi:superfamily II DNA or RNA helicase
MQLREHQVKSEQMLRQSVAAGNKRIILGACTSFGKTVMAAKLSLNALEKGKKVLFICDRIKLIQQSLDTFERLNIGVNVIQGSHILEDWSKPVAIASVQTLSRRRRVPDADLVIVDECHVHYKFIDELMKRWSNVVFIGLSATPYAKGLGLAYQDLVVPVTPNELLDKGYLTPITYYTGSTIDTSGYKNKRNKFGAKDYDPRSMEKFKEDDEEVLCGDIIKNWKKYANGKMTIAFSRSIRHSKYLVEQFNNEGIPAVHIDGYMDDELRQLIFKDHREGRFLILSCSQLLTVGYDEPAIECMIDAYPTKSLTVWVQRVGRIMRIAPGKERAIVLDHAGNVRKLGPAEDIVPESLSMDEKGTEERKLIKDKKEPRMSQCPECGAEMAGVKCNTCGYVIPITEQIKTTSEILQEYDKKKHNKEVSKQDKQKFYSELILYCSGKGYKMGWAANKYRERFGVWPNKMEKKAAMYVSEETQRYIKHLAIKFAKGNKNDTISR